MLADSTLITTPAYTLALVATPAHPVRLYHLGRGCPDEGVLCTGTTVRHDGWLEVRQDHRVLAVMDPCAHVIQRDPAPRPT